MSKKFYILLIILTLGFFALPTMTYACGTNSVKPEKLSYSPKKNNQSIEKDCCKNHSSKKSEKGCSGKCKNKSCHCINSCYSFIYASVGLKNISKLFTDSSKQRFYHNESFLSSGFISIWTPPNIG